MARSYIMSFILSLMATLCFGFTPNSLVDLDNTLLRCSLLEDAPPTITCPGNVVSPCAYLDPNVFPLAPTTFDDNGIVLQTYTLAGATTASSPGTGINDADGEFFDFGITTVTYYVEDAEGGSASCSFTVQVTDTQNPLILCGVDVSASTDPGECYATLNIPLPTAYDSCSGILVTALNIPPLNQYPPGTTIVTWLVTDAVGNTASCTQNVTVTDTEPPAIVCGPNVTVNTGAAACDANVTVPPPSIIDNCGPAGGTITNDYNGGGADASGIYPSGTTTVTYTATDSNGFVTTCSKDVIVINNSSPTITLGETGPLTLEICTPYIEAGATAIDPCLGDLSASIIIDSSGLNINAVGTYNVTYNLPGYPASEEILTINVIDTTAPEIVVIGPNPLTIGDCSTYTELGAEVNECFGDIAATSLVITGSVNTSVLGNYTITYNATDASGNVATSITRDIVVIDNSGPTINISLGFDLNGDDIIDTPFELEACDTFVPPPATAIDPCFGVDYTSSIVIDDSLLDNTMLGSYLVSYYAEDALGNPSTTMYIEVIVVDNTGPIITLNGDNPLTIESCNTYVEPGATAIDCITDLTSSIVIDNSTVDTTTLGTYFVTYDVVDANGNATQEIRTVVVADTITPTILCQDITVQLDPGTGTASILPADVNNGSSDNCPLVLTVSPSTFDCSNLGANVVTLSATDSAGNTATCDAIVTITDLSDNASVVISESAALICENDSVTFTATPSNAGTPTYQWYVNGAPIFGQIGSTFTSTTLTDGDEITVAMTSSLSACALPVFSNSIFIAVSDYNPPAEAGPDVTNSVCTDTIVNLAATPVTGSGATTMWTVTSGQVTGFSFSDPTSPTATFTGDVGETYILTWSIDNPEPCIDTSDSMTISFIGCNAIDFDGVDDNITFRNNYNFSSNFSIEIWAKTDANSANIQTVFSKREVNDLVHGYDLRVVNNIVSFNWNNGQSLSSPFAITNNTWYHIAVTFNAGTYTLYIDGVEMNSSAGSIPISNDVDCIVGAMDQKTTPPYRPLNYFGGTLDELRIWDQALTVNEIRTMMNQEVEDSLGALHGSIVPLRVASLDWIDLYGYYQMNQATDIVGGNLQSNGNSGITGRLRNMVTDQVESAPLPYLSTQNGLFFNGTTWLYGNVQQVPNNTSINGTTPIDWNIVRTSHNVIQRNNNVVLLGLDVVSNEFTVENTNALDGHSLRLTHYLKLDGLIDLVGESQLIQDSGSIVDDMSAGVLERDQQGTTNLYNYNYWTSPVNTGTNTYSIGGVLHDGTTATNPQTILWTGGHDAPGTANPITLSSRWLYSFENFPIDSYADWVDLDESSSLNVGLGFTMKGSGSPSPDQNYVFIGKPNNGPITTPIVSGNQALVGNPYPSAIDAHEFINDNSGSILGTLYFWEHYVSNNTHVLSAYEGGYASYNLSGGNGAISPPLVSGNGTPFKVPERYVPVSQGFFVESNNSGGSILFENDQRVFVKEAVTGAANNGSVFFRSSQDGHRDVTQAALIKRMRLHFKTPEGAIRPLLLAFVSDNLATDGIDYGYDAINTETFPNDMSWMIEDTKHIIQGVGAFDADKRYPLGIFLNSEGQIEISLQKLENFENEINVYVYDALLDSYAAIDTETNYTASLVADEYINRFYITFSEEDNALSVDDDIIQQTVISYLQDSNEIYIKTPYSIDVQQVYLINILGQSIKAWNATNTPMSHEFTIPVKNVSEGAYVLKVETSTGTVNKKIIIQYK